MCVSYLDIIINVKIIIKLQHTLSDWEEYDAMHLITTVL